MLDQTGAPDRSEPNFCEDERRAGQETRPYGVISVLRSTMPAADTKTP